MTVLLISIGFVGLFFLLMSVRILFAKGGEFRGTCSSNSPWLVKKGATCGYCGKKMNDEEGCAEEKNVPLSA